MADVNEANVEGTYIGPDGHRHPIGERPVPPTLVHGEWVEGATVAFHPDRQRWEFVPPDDE